MSKQEPRAAQIFARALEIADEVTRRAYIEHSCVGNETLLTEVESLLTAHDEAGKFLEAPVDGALLGTPTSSGAAPEPDGAGTRNTPAEQPGDCIGRYKLLEKIGQGGFGDVWMAEQEEPVRRRVALKIIKLGMDTKEVVARFEAERQALALMDHPNIAKVHDGGATESGRPYFVMELVRGIRITDYCDANNLSTIERLNLFMQVCQAVQHAHQKGIIHRDLKPSNILVTVNDGTPVPKVIDFGIAKATEQRLTDKTVFTRFMQFLGTPAYMSPEQAELTSLDIDTRSDIYSLGVLLYELLTGRTPFDAKELLEAGLDEIRRTIREKEPVRPSTRLSTLQAADQTEIARRRQADAPKLIRLLRGDLDWIAMKALEKDRTRRYETANAFAQDIRRHLANEPVSAAPPSFAYRARRFANRNRTAVGFAAVVATLLLATVVLAIRSAVVERHQRSRLAEQRTIATNEAARSKTLFLEAERSRKQTETALYTSYIHLAYQAWEQGDADEAEQLLNRCPAELRHWEWHYLNRLCHNALFTLEVRPPEHEYGADKWIDGQITFLADRRRLYVSAGWSWDAAVFDVVTGQRFSPPIANNRTLRWLTPDQTTRFVPATDHQPASVLDVITGQQHPLDYGTNGVWQEFTASDNAAWVAVVRSNGVE